MMRVNKLLAKPEYNIDFKIEGEGMTLVNGAEGIILNTNVINDNFDKYDYGYIQFVEGVPKYFKTTKSKGLDGFTKTIIPNDVNGEIKAVIVGTDGVVYSEDLLISSSPIRIICDSTYLMPESTGELDIKVVGLPNDEVGYSVVDVKYVKELPNYKDYPDIPSNIVELGDEPEILRISKDGNYKTGLEGSVVIFVHIKSEKYKIDILSPIQIIVDEVSSLYAENEMEQQIDPAELDALEKQIAELKKQK